MTKMSMVYTEINVKNIDKLPDVPSYFDLDPCHINAYDVADIMAKELYKKGVAHSVDVYDIDAILPDGRDIKHSRKGDIVGMCIKVSSENAGFVAEYVEELHPADRALVWYRDFDYVNDDGVKLLHETVCLDGDGGGGFSLNDIFNL